MIIFIIHRLGKLNGAKKISNDILNIIRNSNEIFLISPYPHDFKLNHILKFFFDYIKFTFFHLKIIFKQGVIYFSASNNTIGFLKDFPLIFLINILSFRKRKIVHFHSNIERMNIKLLPVFNYVYRNWIHIYLGNNLVPQKKPTNYRVIPNHVEINRSKFKILNNEKIKVGYYGNLINWKGIDDFSEIANYFSSNTNLLFYAAGVGNEKSIKSENIFFMGEISDERAKEEYLSQLDILLYPSYWDAQPLVILEAMNYSTCVIAYNVGAIAEMIPSRDDVIELGEINQIISRVKFYTNNVGLIKETKKKNFNHLINNFGTKKFEKNIKNLLLQ